MHYVMLFAVAMGVLIAGTRLALARPAHWFLRSAGPGRDALLMTALAVLPVAAALDLAGVPLEGTFYVHLAVIGVIVVLFTRSVARSWPARAAVGALSVVAGEAWAIDLSWLAYSLAAAFIAVAVITVLRPRLSFRLAAAAMLVLAADDFIQVSVTRASVAADTAADPFMGSTPVRSGITGVPGVIGIPEHAALLSHYAIMLGVGDLTLPGMLIVIAGRAGQQAGTSRLYAAAVAGYGAGLAACLSVAAVTRALLPAMAFLVPAVVIAVAVTARQAGAWPALTSKDPGRPVTAADAPQPAERDRPSSPASAFPAR